MDRLPPEIISNIVGHVEDQKDQALTPLSVVCRRWQPIVEAKIYRQLRLYYASRKRPSSKPRRNPSYELLASILTPTRLSYIRQLHVTFSRRRRQSFPVSDTIIEQLFDLLTRVPHNQEPLLRVDVRFYNFFGVFFESTPPGGLPELPMVRSCQLLSFAKQKALSPRALLYIASKMPRLRDFDAYVMGGGSIHHRIELARSLAELPASIHNFSLRYPQRDGEHSLLVEENGEDVLARELRRFSQREGLQSFTFYGWIGPSILWPPHSAAASEPRQWPTLKSFVLHSLDHAENVNAFIQALAKCTACMPKAEYNTIGFFDIWMTSLTYWTMFPGDPCVTLYCCHSLELAEESVGEWRKTAEAHNLDFQMRVERRPGLLGVDPVIIS